MTKQKIRTIAITMGDPSGVGPEVILKSYEKKSIRGQRVIVTGDFNIMQKAYNMLKPLSYGLRKVPDMSACVFEPSCLNILDLSLIDMNEFHPGILQAASGSAAYECIRKAVDLFYMDLIDAIVTSPLNKEALHAAGKEYPGHTELLASLTGAKDYAMLLYDKKLSVVHVSTHISLLDSIKRLRKERIEKVIMLADEAMRKLLARRPRIAVAGINPHAGENGLFGKEEIEEIRPAVVRMKQNGIDVEGPFPPDTVFLQTLEGKYDIVVAMYHDQGHIPLKLIAFSSGVNITVGLPVIRTSVDHGTAFDIAWQGKADETSMVNAIKIAFKLAE